MVLHTGPYGPAHVKQFSICAPPPLVQRSLVERSSFPGSGISVILADKATNLGILVWEFDGGA